MVGLGTALLALGGGALAGGAKVLSDSMTQDAITNREQKLEQIREQYNTQENQKNRDLQLDLDTTRGTREAAAAELANDRAVSLEDTRQKNAGAIEKQREDAAAALEDKKTNAQRGMLTNSQQFADGNNKLWLRLPDGNGGFSVKPVLGPDGQQLDGERKPADGQLEEVYAADSPTLSRLVPRSQAVGQPSGKNADKVVPIVADQQETARRDAQKQAQAEADDKAGFWRSDETDFAQDGGSRSAFIERRTNEILGDRRKATTGGTGSPSAPANKPTSATATATPTAPAPTTSTAPQPTAAQPQPATQPQSTLPSPGTKPQPSSEPIPQAKVDAAWSTVTRAYPAVAGTGIKVQTGQGDGFAETYPADEAYNPNPGTPTIEVRKPGMTDKQTQQLLLGESLHILPKTDPRFAKLQDDFIASMQPSQIKVAQKMFQQAQAEGDKRSFDDFTKDVVAPAFIRDYVWSKTGGTPGGEKFVDGVGPINGTFFKENLPALDGIVQALKTPAPTTTQAQPQSAPAPTTTAALKGSGSRADPYQAATQQDVDWFKANAAPGAVIVINGKTYTK